MKIDKSKIGSFFGSKRNRIITGAIAGVLAIVLVVCLIAGTGKKEETVYRETQVEKGNLTVGVEEDGTIAVGTTTQTLDIDLSAYTSSSDFSFDNMSNMSAGGAGGMGGGNAGGGMDIFGNSSGTSSTASGDRTLEVSAVYVSVGQTVNEGDPLVKLTEESVEEIRSQLEEDVTSAEVTYKEQETEAELSDLSSDQTLESNTNKGSYAQTEYALTVEQLQTAVDDAQEKLDEAREKLDELNADLEEYQANVTEYKSVLANAEYTASNIDVRDSVYGWTTAENAREEAQMMYDTLLDNIESTEDSIKSQEDTVADCESDLASAINDQKQGLIDAQATCDKALIDYNNKDELYDVETGQTDLAVATARDDYDEAQEKLDEFNSCIDGQTILSGYSGVITEVLVNSGDYIGTGTELITVNDYDDVTVTVSLEEENVEYAQEGCAANIYIDSLPDEEFTAEVTEVGDATYDSSTDETYYDITVTLSGNTEKLYEGMSAEVTFITKESAEVIYVSNRAIIRENGRSMVKMKDESGNIITKEVTTGFSDGNNVEIKSGLEEGDVVLIESKVSD